MGVEDNQVSTTGGIIALLCFLTLPCFLSFFFFVYEISVVLCTWLCGRNTKGIIQKFTWPIRDGLTYLWMCDRSKWQALEETVVSGSGSSSDNGNKKQYKKHYRRPQIWWIVYKPLGVGIQTSRKSFLDSGKAKDNFGKPPTCCNRFCRQTDYHLSRIEMSYEKSLSVQPFQIVDMTVCSFLCCTRADLKPNCNRATYLLRTLCCSIMLFLLGIGMCLFVIIVNNSGVITSINVGAIIFEIKNFIKIEFLN